jgi:TRAP-type C4-dicarboxylate transport system permease large subunit
VDSFIVSLFIAWRLAGVLMDFALLISIVSAAGTRRWPRKTKQWLLEKATCYWWPLTECCY